MEHKVDKDNINTQGNVDISKIGASRQGDVDKANINAQGFMNQELEKVKGTETRKTIIGQGDQDVRKMKQQTTEEDKTAARQSKYARGLAGMF